MSALRQQVERSAGPGIGVGVADPEDPATGLDPLEVVATTHMIDKRLREFSAGRVAARQAMEAAGLPLSPVPMDTNRSPCWPEGVVGSISHCNSAALAIVASGDTVRALGIDMEEAEPLDRALWDTVLTAREQARIHDGLTAKRIFCAKEAVYKAQFPLTGQMLDFHDLDVTFEGKEFIARTAGNDTWRGAMSMASVRSRPLIVSMVVLR